MKADDFIGLFVVAFVLSCVAAWCTHVVVCIQSSQWLLLIAGALVFPVGMVHGYGWWFGVWT